MFGGHVEGPEVFLDPESFAPGRNDKAGYTPCATVASAGAGENEIMSRGVQAGIPNLGAANPPTVAVAACLRFHPGRI